MDAESRDPVRHRLPLAGVLVTTREQCVLSISAGYAGYVCCQYLLDMRAMCAVNICWICGLCVLSISAGYAGYACCQYLLDMRAMCAVNICWICGLCVLSISAGYAGYVCCQYLLDMRAMFQLQQHNIQ